MRKKIVIVLVLVVGFIVAFGVYKIVTDSSVESSKNDMKMTDSTLGDLGRDSSLESQNSKNTADSTQGDSNQDSTQEDSTQDSPQVSRLEFDEKLILDSINVADFSVDLEIADSCGRSFWDSIFSADYAEGIGGKSCQYIDEWYDKRAAIRIFDKAHIAMITDGGGDYEISKIVDTKMSDDAFIITILPLKNASKDYREDLANIENLSDNYRILKFRFNDNFEVYKGEIKNNAVEYYTPYTKGDLLPCYGVKLDDKLRIELFEDFSFFYDKWLLLSHTESDDDCVKLDIKGQNNCFAILRRVSDVSGERGIDTITLDGVKASFWYHWADFPTDGYVYPIKADSHSITFLTSGMTTLGLYGSDESKFLKLGDEIAGEGIDSNDFMMNDSAIMILVRESAVEKYKIPVVDTTLAN